MADIRDTSTHYQRVAQFMDDIGQATPDKVTVPSQEVRRLRAALILEETIEVLDALGFEVEFPDWSAKPDGSVEPMHVAKELADLSVVTMGTLIAFGIPDEELMDRVDSNNDLKVRTGHRDPVSGKWVKSTTHPKPDLDFINDLL